jgi:nucleoside-diphosphate-sugar epimerase
MGMIDQYRAVTLNDRVFITGMVGFIGTFLAKRIMECGAKVVGLDNMSNYYDVSLKEFRLRELNENDGFEFIKSDLSDKDAVNALFKKYRPEIVVNLAVQAGVRYSITTPDAYINSNIIGFFNVLEVCRYSPVKHLMYASSSSVYGSNKKTPYSTADKVDNPVSLYAATKKSNELMAYAYSKLYGIPTTGLRFFTVYDPAGRPDMAYFNLTNKLVKVRRLQFMNRHCRTEVRSLESWL